MSLPRDPRSAIASGVKRYVGAVCPEHPELGGERNARSRGCIGCNRARMQRKRAAKPEFYREQSRASYLKNREKHLEKTRVSGRLRRTGMDDATYKLLFAMQDGKCAICFRGIAGRTGHADHCHETGEVRGLLCSTCNQAEGLIRRSGFSAYEFGKRLMAYLEYPPARYLE